MVEVNLRVLFHHSGEAQISLAVGRHHQLSGDFQHHGAATYMDAVAAQMCGIGADGSSGLHIVASDIGRVVVGRGLALKEYHRYTAFLCSSQTGRERAIFVGRDDQQVDAGINETVDLLPLPLGVVISVSDAYLHIGVVEMLGREHFIVHLVTPPPTDTLRHTYLIFIRGRRRTAG